MNYKILKQVDKLLIIEKIAKSSTDEVGFIDICYSAIISQKLQLEKSFNKRMRKLPFKK